MGKKRQRRARKKRLNWKRFPKSCGKGKGHQSSGELPALMLLPTGERPASEFTITSAFDGDITYPAQYGNLSHKPGIAPEHHLPKAERAAYERKLRKMTRKAYRQIRAMEAEIWIGRSLAGGDRHSRPPYWRDWVAAHHDIRRLVAGECRAQAALTLKVPSDHNAYGTGMDVESRMQMSQAFADAMEMR